MSNKRHSDHIQVNPSAKSCLSTIGPGLVVFGNVSSVAEIHVYGRISGDVQCSRLIIGLGGRIEGNVSAQHVEVQGELAGGASARIVRVGSTGQVDGDVRVENFTIEPGGRFDGLCRRTDFRGQIIDDPTSIDDAAVVTEEPETDSETAVPAEIITKQTSRLAVGQPNPLRLA